MNRMADKAWGGANGPSAVVSQPTTPPLLLDLHETARALRVSERTAWALAKEGALPCVRIRRRLLFDPADLRAFIERQKTGGAGAAKKSGNPLDAISGL